MPEVVWELAATAAELDGRLDGRVRRGGRPRGLSSTDSARGRRSTITAPKTLTTGALARRRRSRAIPRQVAGYSTRGGVGHSSRVAQLYGHLGSAASSRAWLGDTSPGSRARGAQPARLDRAKAASFYFYTSYVNESMAGGVSPPTAPESKARHHALPLPLALRRHRGSLMSVRA